MSLRGTHWIPLALLCVAGLAAGDREAKDTGTQSEVTIDREELRRFIATYCLECHDSQKKEGDQDFSALGDPGPDSEEAWTWELITEQLSLSEMPPRKAEQPDDEERRAVVEWICSALAGENSTLPGAQARARLRRLSAFEYRNTIRDLLDLDISIFDPTSDFPPDQEHDGFDNVGEALVTSSFLLERYLQAADAGVGRAIREGPRPASETRVFRPPFMKWGGGLLPDVVRKYTDRFEDLYTRPMGLYGYVVPDELSGGVPAAGEYIVRVKAAAVGRNHPYATLHTDPIEPLRMGVVAAPITDGDLRGKSPSEVRIAEFELSDEGPATYEKRVWLEAGSVPRITYPNGPRVMPMLAFLNLRAKHHPELVDKHAGRAWKDEGERLYTEAREFLEVYTGPRVRVFEIEIEGPLYDRWPPASHVSLLGEEAGELDPRATLTRFAQRAFRRPTREEDIAPILELAEAVAEREEDPLAGIRTGLQAILCAPEFIYLYEPEGRLDEHALAARLSYFLWSSMPDAELRRLADDGRLWEPGVLRAQAKRMLGDPRARAFVSHFTDRWLQLHRIGAMPPDPERFPRYFRSDLEHSMPIESHEFFAHLLAEDLDIANFLDSDFTFVDSNLARFYGVRGVTGSQFQKVKLPDRRRGGLLGQAGVLTATANGIDTSPVIRGVWVLENVLGTPPKPPPPSAGSLDPDTRGATDIRSQLAKHRADESCNSCHRKIDPLGFPLENYDPIGAWRGSYAENGRAIDASAIATDGTEIKHVGDLKIWLLGRKRQFARCLTEKLVTYATGAPVEPPDRAHIEALIRELDAAGYGLRSLVLSIVESELFVSK